MPDPVTEVDSCDVDMPDKNSDSESEEAVAAEQPGVDRAPFTIGISAPRIIGFDSLLQLILNVPSGTIHSRLLGSNSLLTFRIRIFIRHVNVTGIDFGHGIRHM
jgi:hypothetical protein